MARARNIKPGFFTNEDLAECSFEARLLFAGLWTVADRAGRLEDRPKRIKAQLFPYDRVDCDKLLDELAQHRFIRRYSVGHLSLIDIPGFERNQNPHHTEKASELPEHPGGSSFHNGDLTVKAPLNNGLNPADSLNTDSLIPDSLNTPCSPPRGTKYAKAFLDWWEAYPKKTGKDRAYKAWKSAGKRIRLQHDLEWQVAADRMLEAARAFAESETGRSRFCPHPATWLNAGQYDDDRTTWNRGDEKQLVEVQQL